MPLVNMKDMLLQAYKGKYCVGAFDLVSLDFLEAIMKAAENTRAPVILSLAESHFEYFDFELAMAATERAAQRASVPVAIHLDHGHSFESAKTGINLGCNGVMVDASHLSLQENIEVSHKVAEMAHACGVPVEGELGYVPGVEGEDAEKHPGEVQYTTVEQAKEYVSKTGVDFLAVSVGTVHGRMQGNPELDFERLGLINQALQIPLVIHGGTGLTENQYSKLIENGVTKINYYTALSDAAGAVMKNNATRNDKPGYVHVTKGTIDAMTAECERMIKIWGSDGRADEILAIATPWTPVEHVIIFNTEGLDEAGTIEMMAEGKRVLSAIPGVRHVVTGKAVQGAADYKYCWLIRFCHPDVIESYKHHPDHVAFADNLFRPVAGNRISIDYA